MKTERVWERMGGGAVGAALGSAVANDDGLAADSVDDGRRSKERVGEIADVQIAAAAHCKHGAERRVG